jgi:hypothetical protein
MSKSYRAGNGKFIRKDNPFAVIQRQRELREREQERLRSLAMAERKRNAVKHGYRGPLTRQELTNA